MKKIIITFALIVSATIAFGQGFGAAAPEENVLKSTVPRIEGDSAIIWEKSEEGHKVHLYHYGFILKDPSQYIYIITDSLYVRKFYIHAIEFDCSDSFEEKIFVPKMILGKKNPKIIKRIQDVPVIYAGIKKNKIVFEVDNEKVRDDFIYRN